MTETPFRSLAQPPFRRWIRALAWGWPVLACLACAGPDAEPPAPSAAAIRLDDVSGKAHTPLAGASGEVVVVVFAAVDCPIANASMPAILRVAETVHAADGRLYVVHPRAGQSAAEAREHAARFGLSMPVLLDGEHELVDALDARVTPEAFVFVFDAPDSARLAYRGRIDDLYADLGRRRNQATRHDLRDAVQAVLAGDDAAPGVEAIGCFIERRP